MKSRLIGILLGLGLAGTIRAADPDALMRAAAAAEIRMDPRAALQLLLQADILRPNDAHILQKIARQYSDLVPGEPTIAEKKRDAEQALGYAQRATALDPKDPVNVLSLAICHGTLGLYSDTREKIRYSRLVREEAGRALALDPNYAWAHHVLGCWDYEVASLGFASRFAVRLFYGGLPEASCAEGVRQLQRATELEPDELNHWLDLGFAYSANGQPAAAKAAWEHGLAMPSRGTHDDPAKARAREALARLQ